MARYLLSGGAGFVGSHLTDALIRDGHEVVILDNFSTGTEQNFSREIYENDRLTIQECDVTTPLPVEPTFDVVCHLASIPTPGEYMDQPIQTLRAGADGTRHTLDVAVKSNATYLLTSTSEVYGDPEVHPQVEAYNGNVDPYGPRACYDESKRYAEALVRGYREKHDLDVRVARIFNTYGPRMRDDRVIPAFVTQAKRGKALTVHGNGTQTRSFCYISDLVRGLRFLIDSNYEQPINLGNSDERTIQNLAHVVRDVVNADIDLRYTERPPDDPNMRQPDITIAQEELNWSPSVSLRDGIERILDAEYEYR